MTEVMERQNTYLADFERMERELAASGTPAVHRLRKAAAARFAELGFPGPRDEEWRFTPVAPLTRTPFEAVSAEQASKSCSLRIPPLPNGVIVCGLSEAIKKHASLAEPHLARHADWNKHPFIALNTAFLRDGIFVYVPRGAVLEEPIFLDFSANRDGEGFVWHPRCLVILG